MATTYSPGLEGITAGITAISEVDADRNELIYRGYNIRQLVKHVCFDEVAHLLIYGDLPNAAELAEFMKLVGVNRAVPGSVYDLYRTFPQDAHPMDALKTAVSFLGMFDPEKESISHSANVNKAVRLYAQIPNLVVNGYRIMHGQEPILPDPDLEHTGSFFQMLTGQTRTDFFAEALDATQILYAEHGFNASTFSARVTVSTLSDLHSGVVSAIGTLKGPLHGGANEAAMAMLLEIGDPAHAAEWIQDALAKKKKIMGFGHREYKHGDERAKIVKQYCIKLAHQIGSKKWTEVSQIVEDEMMKAKGLYPNLDFPVAGLYYMMEIPIELYTPIFVMSRITGWCAHIIEQLDNNRIIRPHNEYNGPRDRNVEGRG